MRWYLEDGLGSVVGLADETGALVARRDYDAFGNLAAATGEADPAHQGGALALHGQWREAASDLYHLRARDYDPTTGRFLSRDPADGDPLEPESLHPYLFAHGNPLLFQDPTGFFSVTEVNLSSTIQTSVSATRKPAFNVIHREIVEDIRETMVDLLVDAMLAWLGPGLSNFVQPAGLSPQRVGGLFEETVQEMLCEIVPAGVLHFEVGIDQGNGVATDGGYGGCPPQRRNFGGVKDIRRPDILVNQGSPMARDQSLLISEVKLGIGSFYRAWKKKRRGQWEAISLHSQRFAFPPHAVVLIAFKDGKRYHRRFLERILRRGEHYGVVISVLGGQRTQ